MRFAIIAFAMYPLNIISRDGVRGFLDLQPDRVFSNGELWRLASYPLIFPDVLSLTMFIIALLLFGGVLERLWRPQRLAVAFGAITLSQGTVWIVAPFAGQPPTLCGAEALTFFILSSSFWLYPQRFITLWKHHGIHTQATVFALIMVSLGAIGYTAVIGEQSLFLQGAFQSASGILAGLVASFIYQHNRTTHRAVADALPAEMATVARNAAKTARAPEYNMTADNSENAQIQAMPTGNRQHHFGLLNVGKRIHVMCKALLGFKHQRFRVNAPQENYLKPIPVHNRFNDEDYSDEDRLNFILDIIFEHGYDSLRPEEKKFLDCYSRNLH